jgi:hypothetical protein
VGYKRDSHTRSRRGHKNGNFLPIDLRTRYVLAYLPGDEPGIKCGSSRCCPVEPWIHLLLQAFSHLLCQAYSHRMRQARRRLLGSSHRMRQAHIHLLCSAIGCAKPTSMYQLTAIECVKLTVTTICWANFLSSQPSDALSSSHRMRQISKPSGGRSNLMRQAHIRAPGYQLTAIECVKLTAICWANFLGCLPSDGRCAKLIASDAPNF